MRKNDLLENPVERAGFPRGAVSQAVAAIHLADLALRWRTMRDLACSAARRLEEIHRHLPDGRLRGQLYLVLWTLRRLPYARASLVRRALEDLKTIQRYVDQAREESGT